MHEGMYVYLCMYMWRSEVDVRWFSSSALQLLETVCLTEKLISLARAAGLLGPTPHLSLFTSLPPASVHFPKAGVARMLHYAKYFMFLGLNSGSRAFMVGILLIQSPSFSSNVNC